MWAWWEGREEPGSVRVLWAFSLAPGPWELRVILQEAGLGGDRSVLEWGVDRRRAQFLAGLVDELECQRVFVVGGAQRL